MSKYQSVRVTLSLIIGLGAAAPQTTIDLRTQGKGVDFAAAPSTRPSKTGSALPATCKVGETFFNTSAPPGSNWYGCSPIDTWMLQGGAGGGATMASQLLDFRVTKTSNTQLAIASNCSAQTPCNVLIGSTIYSIRSSSAATLSAGTGAAYIYLDVSGALTVGHNLTLTCAPGCQAVTGVTALPPDTIPLYTWTATNGIWDDTGNTDLRAVFSQKHIQPSTGIIVSNSGNASQVAIDTTVVPTVTGANTFTGSNDFSAATATKPNRTVASDPSGACSNNNEVVLSTVSGDSFSCWSGTWHKQGGVGGSGTVTHTSTALTTNQFALGNAGADIKVGDLSGDVSTAGGTVTSIGAGKVTNAMLAGSIATSKLASPSGNGGTVATTTGAQTQNTLVTIDASGNHIASGVTIDNLNNVTTPGTLTTGGGGAIIITGGEGSVPASPPASQQSLFIDSVSHHLKRVNSSGTVVDIETGAGGPPGFNSITTGTNTAAAMLVGAGASLGPAGTGTIQATTVVDSNQKAVLNTAAAANAVDQVTVFNAATANPATVTVAATGTDANINLLLQGKGVGKINLGSSNATVDSAGALTVTSCIGCGSSTAQKHAITFSLDGGGAAVTTGDIKQYPVAAFACTINRIDISSDQSGSITVDVWKKSGAIPTSADKISASAPLTLSSAQLASNGSLTGWTTSVSTGDIFGFSVASVSTVTKVTGQIWCQ